MTPRIIRVPAMKNGRPAHECFVGRITADVSMADWLGRERKAGWIKRIFKLRAVRHSIAPLPGSAETVGE